MDLVSKVIDVKSETGRRYAQKIKEFRTEYIFEVDTRNVEESKESKEKLQLPIVDVIKQLTQHYIRGIGEMKMEDLKLLFTIEEIFDNVIAFFQTQLISFQTTNMLTASAFDELDKLISQAKSISAQSKIEKK